MEEFPKIKKLKSVYQKCLTIDKSGAIILNCADMFLRILPCDSGGIPRDHVTCFSRESYLREAVPQSDPGRPSQAGLSRN